MLKTTMIRKYDGTIITDKVKIVDRFKSMFHQEMLKQPENRTTVLM